MYDFFHDGWDGAELYVETPWGDVFSSAPTCQINPRIETLCSEVGGHFPMVLIHENDNYIPKNYWEVKIITLFFLFSPFFISFLFFVIF